MYAARSEAGKRPATTRPTETAGLRWQPEMCPMAYAMVSTVRPKANETPSRPIPTLGKPAARTALPQPPKTSQNVPKSSAAARLDKDMKACSREDEPGGGALHVACHDV